MAFRLTSAYVEYIHDVIVPARLAFDEPIDPSGYKDLALLESAVNRPFCTYDGVELYPTITEKAAALFHSLVCNHCFFNGNKRTGLVALDLFLCANGILFATSNQDAYLLARQTAEANIEGRSPQEVLDTITNKIASESIEIGDLRVDPEIEEERELGPVIEKFRRSTLEKMHLVRSHALNQNQ